MLDIKKKKKNRDVSRLLEQTVCRIYEVPTYIAGVYELRGGTNLRENCIIYKYLYAHT
jgi:hypothetical protein